MKTAHIDNDDPSAFPIVVVGGIGALLFVAIILALEAFYGSFNEEQTDERVSTAEVSEALQLYHDEQSEALETYRWVDREAGVVSIPIERSMEILAQEQQ